MLRRLLLFASPTTRQRSNTMVPSNAGGFKHLVCQRHRRQPVSAVGLPIPAHPNWRVRVATRLGVVRDLPLSPPAANRVQLCFRTGLIGAQYVKAQGWRHATLARCPLPLGRRLFVRAARRLRPQDTARHADRALVLSREPHHVQPAAGLSGGAAAGPARQTRGRRGRCGPRPERGRGGDDASRRALGTGGRHALAA